jgi:hypothetical protein
MATVNHEKTGGTASALEPETVREAEILREVEAMREAETEGERVDGQSKAVDGPGDRIDRQVESRAAECATAIDGRQSHLEKVSGAVCEDDDSSPTIAIAAERREQRAAERVRVRWGSNNSKKYDGKIEDVPAQWVTGGSVAVGEVVTVSIKGGKSWNGTVIEVFYQKNPLDLALPIKRTRNHSPVSSR